MPEVNDNSVRPGSVFSEASLLGFFLAACLAVKAGGYSQPGWMSQVQMVIGWRSFFCCESTLWNITRCLYIIATCSGFIGYARARHAPTRAVWAGLVVSALALVAGIVAFVLVPDLAHPQGGDL